jgi:spore maturation protein CgeB
MRKKRILIVGSTALWAIENIYAKYLNELGTDTTIFNSGSFISSSYWHRGVRRLGFDWVYKAVNKELLLHCESVKPDIVWVFKGIEIFPETLVKIKAMGIMTVNYNPDHPFIRSFRSSGGENIPQSIPLYDLHFCYSKALGEKIKTDYHIPTVWLPFGYELSAAQYEMASKEPEIQKICFVGNPDKKRVQVITDLSKNGLSIDLYGHGWDKFLKNNKNITCFDGIYQDDFWKVLRRYRLQLNIFREHNEGSHNMRTFEVPAVGGIMLAPDSEEHRFFFKDQQEAIFYSSDDELPNLCSKILSMKSVTDIRKNSRNRSENGNYSYQRRADLVLTELAKL